jgi:hypothetical protein
MSAPNISPETVASLRTLWNAQPKLTVPEIATQSGVCRRYIFEIARAHDFPARGRRGDTKNQDWTEAEVAKLVELQPSLLTNGQIGKAIGKACGRVFSKNAVVGKSSRLGLPERKHITAGRPSERWTDAVIARLRKMRAQGRTVPEIAAEMDMSVHAIKSKIQAERIPLNDREARHLRSRSIAPKIKREFVIDPSGPPHAPTSLVDEPGGIPYTLDARGCCWMKSIGFPWRMCGGDREAGEKYCGDHANRAVHRFSVAA